jgi:hypothetical protein
VTPEQAAHDTRQAIVLFTAGFMSDSGTYARGAELGFQGADFYFAGRGGCLGDVGADVVTAALVFFAPDHVRAAWDRSASVMPRREAAESWAEQAHQWARTHLADDVNWTWLSGTLERVVDGASVAAAPVFAGWRTLPRPRDDKALALHHLNGLRELRGALHGAAVLTVGLEPLAAISVLAPNMLKVMGWAEAALDPEPWRERWQLAEARTDRMFGRHLSVLEAHELDQLVQVLTGMAS